jgi:glyoxylase-like metal-dependent hydrolase (beta-lactamase superfamily II)
MPLEDDFSDILKKARQGRGLTLDELSRLSCVPRLQLVELERGRRSPKPDEVEALARALELRARPLAEIALQGWHPRASGTLDGVETVHGDIGGYAVKGYVLFDPRSYEAIIVDTGYNPESMVQVLERRKLTLKAVCLTHGHMDHAGGLDRVLARWPVPVYIGQGDIDLLHWRPARMLTAIGPGDDGHRLSVGSLEVGCMVTPGHTPGGLCYRVRLGRQEVCFVGDTLFAGSVGRANPLSLYPQHLESVRRRVLALPDGTVLLPGHGPGTTVAEEQEHNPFAAEPGLS